MAYNPHGHWAELQASENSKLVDRQRWSLALLFLEGRQNVRWDQGTNAFVQGIDRQGARKRRSPPIINHLPNIYRNLSARFDTAAPGFVAFPATPATDDIIKAEVTEATARYYWYQAKIAYVLRKHVQWLLSGGTSGFHTYYNPGTDNVESGALDPFNLFFEPGSEDPDESDWIGYRTYHTKRALIAVYPHLEAVIEKLPLSDPTQSRLFGRPFSSVQAQANRVEVFETYWRDGTRVVQVADRVLLEGENALKTIPIRIVRYTTIPKNLWGQGLIYSLVNIQALYNEMRDQILQNARLMGNPKLLLPTNSGVAKDAWTDAAGEKIYFNDAASAPKPWVPPPLPQYVTDQVPLLLSEMQDVAGVHAVSLGKRSVGVSSGVAIDALGSKDSQQLRHTQEDILHAIEGVANDAVRLMRAHYKGKRWIRMFDFYGRMMQRELDATQLQEDPEIFIQSGSLWRDDAQDRDQKVMDYLQLGLLEKDEAKKALSHHLGTSQLQQAADMSHAHQVLDALKQGDFEVEIYKTDPLPVFQEVFAEFLRDPSAHEPLPAERVNYIRDVFLAIAVGGNPQQVAEGQASYKVWPVQPTSDKINQMAGMVAAPESESAQLQQAGQVAETALKRADARLVSQAMEEDPDGGARMGPQRQGRGLTS